MKQQSQLIFAHFGYEKQRLKAKEERLELEIALNKLALYDVREEQGICQDVLREEFITDCNEEFADNVLMRMQLENLDFQEAFGEMKVNFSKSRIYHCYGMEDFYFNESIVKEYFKVLAKRRQGQL